MRIMGLIAALLVLFAVFVGITSLAAFGFSAWEIVSLLAPVAAGVVLFVAGVMYLALLWVRRLNRAAGEPGRNGGEAGAGDGPSGGREH